MITDVTRNEIIDILLLGFDYTDQIMKEDLYDRKYMENINVHVHMNFTGKLDLITFLDRVYNLKEMPSTDPRFENARGDIWQHTINNDDWDMDWFIDYEPFGLRGGTDEQFLDFISQIFHPAVRRENSPWEEYLRKFNELLKFDGYELYCIKKISGRNVYSYRRIATDNIHLQEHIEELSSKFNSSYIDTQLQIMMNSIESNPSDAIGKAKELLESCCITILNTKEIEINKDWSIQRLMKETSKALMLTPEDIDDSKKASGTIKQILGNFAAISSGMAELRNSYGSGHGKNAKFRGLSQRHARLAIGSSITAVRFIWDTFLGQEELKNSVKEVNQLEDASVARS